MTCCRMERILIPLPATWAIKSPSTGLSLFLYRKIELAFDHQKWIPSGLAYTCRALPWRIGWEAQFTWLWSPLMRESSTNEIGGYLLCQESILWLSNLQTNSLTLPPAATISLFRNSLFIKWFTQVSIRSQCIGLQIFYNTTVYLATE